LQNRVSDQLATVSSTPEHLPEVGLSKTDGKRHIVSLDRSGRG